MVSCLMLKTLIHFEIIFLFMCKYHLTIKKEGNPAICANIDEPGGVVLNEISQTEKDKRNRDYQEPGVGTSGEILVERHKLSVIK